MAAGWYVFHESPGAHASGSPLMQKRFGCTVPGDNFHMIQKHTDMGSGRCAQETVTPPALSSLNALQQKDGVLFPWNLFNRETGVSVSARISVQTGIDIVLV